MAGETAFVGVRDEALEQELRDAAAQAQRTARTARERWLEAPPSARDHWAVKWAAPLTRGDELRPGGDDAPPERPPVEYVWVIPVSWSPWRIEGVLASTPQRRIGYVVGDLVGFPVDELADWVHTQDGPVHSHFRGRREGGFTVRVLEREFGRRDDAS